MKKTFVALLSIISVGAMAQDIQGTLMLKGALKTKIMVNGVSSVCKLKVEKVRNLLEEDAFGNPGYQAQVELSLSGSDIERNIKIKMNKSLTVTNMFSTETGKMVKDFDYANSVEKVTVKIDDRGRLVYTTFPYMNQIITCKF